MIVEEKNLFSYFQKLKKYVLWVFFHLYPFFFLVLVKCGMELLHFSQKHLSESSGVSFELLALTSSFFPGGHKGPTADQEQGLCHLCPLFL